MAIVKKRIPGFQDGGNAVEPTTGNDVPIGSLPNEVADDIPARLSEGEFVLPADVVRFIGLERLMKLRDEAKEGLRRMAEVGQMGNAEDVGEKAEESFEEEGGEEEEDTGKFESDIDEILAEVDSVEGQTEQMMADGGVVGTKTGKTTTAGRPVYKTKEGDNVSELSVTVPFKGFWANVPSIHNGVKYKEDQIVEMLEKGTIKPTSVHENISEAVEAAKKRSSSLMPKMAQGGVVGGAPWLTGFDLKKAPKNPVFDVRYYKHPDGRIMYVTFFNGRPMTPIPDGFTPTEGPVEQQVGKEAEAKKEEEQKQMTTPDIGGGIGAGDGGGAGAGIDIGAISKGDASALATGTNVSAGAVKAGAAALSLATGLPFGLATAGKSAQNIADFLSQQSGKMAGQQNIDAVGKAFGFDTSTVEGRAAASSVIDSMTARAGSPLDQESTSTGGRGGAAAAASAAAASEATSLGLSSSSAGRAGQAAADAVLAGRDQASAVQEAVTAAAAAEASAGAQAGTNTAGPDGMDIGPGYSFKKGGLVSKRQKPMKKPKGKGLAAR